MRASFGFVLLKPDVVLRGILRRVLFALRGAGFELLDFRIGKLTEPLFGHLFDSRFRWDVDDWAYNLQAYRYGPVIGALLWRQGALEAGGSAQEYLRAIKGYALPDRPSGDSLRGQLGATSRVFNVLHVPDGFERAVADAGSWFGESFIGKLLPEGFHHRGRRRPSQVALTLEDEVSRHGYLAAPQLNGEATFFLLLARLCHAIEKQLRPHGACLKPLRAGGRSCSAGAADLLEASEIDTRRVIVDRTILRIQSSLHRVKHHVAACAATERDLLEQTISYLMVLCLQGLESGWQIEFFWHLLEEWRVFVSELEKYLVLGIFIYPSLLPLSRDSTTIGSTSDGEGRGEGR